MGLKEKRTIQVALFVSLASLVRIELVTEGFIAALSIMMMGVFIYCFKELTPLYIAILSGIFSPIFRIVVTYIQLGDLPYAVELALPDMMFYLAYGVAFTLFRKFIHGDSINTFLMIVGISDFTSNVVEIGARSIITGSNLYSITVFGYLILIAMVRMIMIFFVLYAVESYSSFLVKNANDKQYKKLLSMALNIETELHVMKKNMVQVEGVMKKAYDLYAEMGSEEYPEDIKKKVLEIAKDTHEVKGDYKNILSIFNEIYQVELQESDLLMSEIMKLEREHIQKRIADRGWDIEVKCRCQDNFNVTHSYKMMSIIRNLLVNSAEAIGKGKGIIVLTSKVEGDNYVITVRDNGCGMREQQLDRIFMEGYSTKFDPNNGNIQRGLGLSLVKDYVEDVFNGTIKADSKLGEYTEFKITIPKAALVEAEQ